MKSISESSDDVQAKLMTLFLAICMHWRVYCACRGGLCVAALSEKRSVSLAASSLGCLTCLVVDLYFPNLGPRLSQAGVRV